MLVYNITKVKEANYLDQWDSGGVLEILNSFNATIINTDEIPQTERAIVLIPARHYVGLENWLNKQLKNIDKPMLICGGDEEASFNIEAIDLDCRYITIQNPHPDKHDKYNKLGTGYPKHLQDFVPLDDLNKDLDVFFSGQITHSRRKLLFDALIDNESKGWHINGTKGFTQGYSKSEYYALCKRAKVMPAPSGAVVPDSFRAFEALECFAVPLLDDVNPSETIDGGYWDWLLGTNPLPKYKNPAEVPAKINEILADWNSISQECISWYIAYKNDIKRRIYEQYNR